MNTCTNCGHEQNQGKFCAKCGKLIVENAVISESKEGQQPTPGPTLSKVNASSATIGEPNKNVEQVKNIAKGYIDTFVSVLKKPTNAPVSEAGFINGIISFVLLQLISAFVVYSMISKVLGELLKLIGAIGEDDDILDVLEYLDFNILGTKDFFTFAIVGTVMSLLTVVVIFLVNKFLVEPVNFKEVFVRVTNFYPSLIAVAVVVYVLQLIGFVSLSVNVLAFLFLATLLLIPLFVMIQLTTGKTLKIDKFYIYTIVAIVNVIIVYLCVNYYISGLKETFVDGFMEEMFDVW